MVTILSHLHWVHFSCFLIIYRFIYKENGFSCIGILEQGIKFIQDNIDEIRKLPCRMPKNK